MLAGLYYHQAPKVNLGGWEDIGPVDEKPPPDNGRRKPSGRIFYTIFCSSSVANIVDALARNKKRPNARIWMELGIGVADLTQAVRAEATEIGCTAWCFRWHADTII